MTECQCENPGYCQRHKMHKSPHFHDLCKNDPRYRLIWDQQVGLVAAAETAKREEPKVKASVVQQAASLGKALFDFVRTGLPMSDQDEQARRLAICKECDKFIPSQTRCAECGCYLNFKSRLESAHCPLKKW